MYRHTFRNKVVTGSLTLPVTFVTVLLLWMLPGAGSGALWGGMAMTGLTAYLMMELNNRNTLLRVRSRLMCSLYLWLMLACPALHDWTTQMIPPACLMLAYFMLFASYQQPRAEGYTFHAFLLTGVASFFFPPALLLAPVFYAGMLFQLRTLTWRTFMAGLLGLLTPYWIYAGYAIWQNRLDTAFIYLTEWFTPRLPDYSHLTLPQLLTLGLTVPLAAVSAGHFIHTAYNDKIRTRMLFYLIVLVEVALAAGMLLLPAHLDTLLRLFIVNSAPLMAHYFALAKGRRFHLWFNCCTLLLAALAVMNHLLAAGIPAGWAALRPLAGVTLW